MQTITINLGAEAAELLGFYNGTLAALAAILDSQGLINARGLADSCQTQAESMTTELGRAAARTLATAIEEALKASAAGNASPLRPALRLVTDNE